MTDRTNPAGRFALAPCADAPNELRARASAFERKHPPRAASTPDTGEVLASFDRSDGTQLRVSLHRYEGKPYLRVAPWNRGEGGTWWPVKGKGTTVKVRELGAVVRGLCDAMDALERDAPPGA